MKFYAGQIFQSDTNIFIKRVNGNMVSFIEGLSPAAIHDMQEIPAQNLEAYIKEWDFKELQA